MDVRNRNFEFRLLDIVAAQPLPHVLDSAGHRPGPPILGGVRVEEGRDHALDGLASPETFVRLFVDDGVDAVLRIERSEKELCHVLTFRLGN